ncbi:MAG: dihydropteroate synthase [Gemmatimonadota bacterium]
MSGTVRSRERPASSAFHAAAVQPLWRTARGTLDLRRPCVVGILNVTPDSFWDGGRHAGVDAALGRAEVLVRGGAGMLDLGGESTRPGARPVNAAEERARVLPVLRALVARWPETPISVDTVKAAVAEAALAEGAAAINDVGGLRLEPRLAEVVGAAGAGLVLMHSRGTVDTMASYELASYGADPVAEVRAELRDALARARAGGVADDALVVDPGLGFAKRTEHSVALLAGLERLGELGCPVMVGPSRKRFLGEVAGGLEAADRLPGTVAACVLAFLAGARLFRVHDVAEVAGALALAEAVAGGGMP